MTTRASTIWAPPISMPDAAELHEVLNGGDVVGHPRDQGAPPLGLDVKDRETVEVLEQLDPELLAARPPSKWRAGPIPSSSPGPPGPGPPDRCPPLTTTAVRLGPPSIEQIVVDDLLDQHRNHQLTGGAENRKQNRDPEAASQRRGFPESSTESAPGSRSEPPPVRGRRPSASAVMRSSGGRPLRRPAAGGHNRESKLRSSSWVPWATTRPCSMKTT